MRASPEAVDSISETFRRLGVSGVAIEPAVEPLADEGFIETAATIRVLAYLPHHPGVNGDLERIEQGLWHLSAFDLAPMGPLVKRVIDEADWANAWKDHFHTTRIGRRLVIRPTWRDVSPAPSDVILSLDPGMAFGTGLHPTTRMMLESIEEKLKPGMRVFDIGTGSGILSVAAAKLGAPEVLAVDLESVACEVARENVRLNDVQSAVNVRRGSIGAGQGKFDLILANIIATVIADLTPEFRKRMSSESRLIVSGIIREREHLVLDAFANHGLLVVDTRSSGDWLCLVARAEAA